MRLPCRLTFIERDAQEPARYQYDPFGRRIAKTLQGFTTWYLYTDEGLIAELDAQGSLTRAYGWEPDSAYGTKPLWQAEIQGASWHFHFLHPDHLGTPQLATDAQGNISWQARSEAFGRTFPAPTNAITMNLRFPGQYYDQESGLHYNYYRDYDPEVGRYVEGDPIGLAGGVNTSVYSVNNPQRFSDARGLEIVGEYFIYPRITIKKIQYRDWIDWGDPSWDPMSAWRIGWYHVRGEGVIDFIVHCIEYDECKNIKHEWFVDKAFDVAVEKTFEIRQNLAGAVTYAYKITEMKLEIEKMLKSKIAEYALDPTTWCIFSRGCDLWIMLLRDVSYNSLINSLDTLDGHHPSAASQRSHDPSHDPPDGHPPRNRGSHPSRSQ